MTFVIIAGKYIFRKSEEMSSMQTYADVKNVLAKVKQPQMNAKEMDLFPELYTFPNLTE